MTDPCLLRDDYLDGRLTEPDAQRFETHAAACDECDAALLADDLGLGDGLGLSALANLTCPPEVLAAALPSARHAPDRSAIARPASRRPRRRAWLATAGLALAAVAVFLLTPRDGSAPVASAEAPVPTVVEPAPTQPGPLDDSTEAEQATGEPYAAAPAETTPTRPSPRPGPPRSPVGPSQSRPAPAVQPELSPVQVAEASPTTDPGPTAEEVEAAARDLALAFAIVDDAQSRAGRTVREEVGDLSSTIDHAFPQQP